MTFAAACLILAALFAVLWSLSRTSTGRGSPREPTTVVWQLPYLGPIIGLIQHGGKFYEFMRDKSHLPIYTTFLLNQKTYFVNSPELISQIYRKQKTIQANDPVIETIYHRILGIDTAGIQLLKDGPHSRGTRAPFRKEMQDINHELLGPGSSMKQLWADTMVDFARRVTTAVLPEAGQSGEYSLSSLIKKIHTPSAARALFGSNNVIDLDPTLVDTFWEFDEEFLNLVVFPLFARRGKRSRQRLVDAFEKHHHEHDMATQVDTSELVKRVINAANTHGCTSENTAKLLLGMLLGTSANSVPSTIWFITFLVSDKHLFETVREEARQIITRPDSRTQRLELTTIKEKCPLLWSTLQETLRISAAGVQTLEVIEDTEIDKYVLQKGALLQIPTLSVHSDKDLWGQDAEIFRADRFVSPEKRHPGSLRPFSGGTATCPARFLAMDIMLSTAIIFVTTFDFDLGPSGGRIPTIDRSPLGAVVKPDFDLKVLMKRRSGQEHLNWEFC